MRRKKTYYGAVRRYTKDKYKTHLEKKSNFIRLNMLCLLYYTNKYFFSILIKETTANLFSTSSNSYCDSISF